MSLMHAEQSLQEAAGAQCPGTALRTFILLRAAEKVWLPKRSVPVRGSWGSESGLAAKVVLLYATMACMAARVPRGLPDES